MNNDELRELAAKRVKAKADFHHYLLVWLGVSIIVVAVWFFSSPYEYFWPIWPIVGMGIGAFFMGINAYSRGVTEDAIDAEVARMSKRSTRGPGA